MHLCSYSLQFANRLPFSQHLVPRYSESPTVQWRRNRGARGPCPPLSKSIHFGPLTFCFCTVRFCICSSFTLINCVPITRVTAISTLWNYVERQIHKLLQIYLTVPMSNATAERSFSVLRRLKTYFRVTMNQERLNHPLFLHIHRHHWSHWIIDLTKVLNTFCLANDRRIQFFAKWLGL